jgi:hypothetical protein
MYDQALATTNGRMQGEHSVPYGAEPDNPASAGASTREMIHQVGRTDQPEVRLLLSTKDADGRSVQTQSDVQVKLVAIDEANDRALVKFPDGALKQVKANEVIYVNDGMKLGALPPAVQRNFETNLNNLSGDDKMRWSSMLGEANKKSQEHVGVLKRMLASGASIDEIQQMHVNNLNLSHEEIGREYSPANLAQHLKKSCVAACIQKADIFFNPQRGQELRSPQAQLDGQVKILENQDVGWEVRRGSSYPHNDNPPVSFKQWREARVNDYEGKPKILTEALKQSNHNDYSVFGLNNLDRRYIHQELQNVSVNRPEFLYSRGQDGKNVVYEVSQREQGPNGDRIFVRKQGEQTGQWWNTKDIRLDEDIIYSPKDNRVIHSEDKVILPDGSVLSHVAVPPDRPLKQATSGIDMVKDESIQNIVRASTGKTLKRYDLKGDDALHAIYQSVQEIGVAGAGVKWAGEAHGHQLLVTGARDLGGGKYSFDVFDPTTGTTRQVSGDQLKSGYNSGRPGDGGVGVLDSVQVPDDMQIGRPGGPGPQELAARNQIELHEPDKLNTLKQIDALPNPQVRSVLTQMLRHEGNDEAMADVLKNSFPDVANLDADAQRNLLDLYKNNRLMMFRGALVELIPTVARLPEAARNHALEQMNSMQGNDLIKTARRLEEATNPNLGQIDDELAMQFALQIFGG